MLKIRRKMIFQGTILAILVLSSCSVTRYHIHDGYYTAEAEEYNEHGWKDYITICVSSGKIILVEFNSFNRSGLLKTWDMNYMRQMNSVSGTYPSAYTRHYGEKLLSFQDLEGVDALSGATLSYHVFIRLAEAVMENARQGNPEMRLVNLQDITGLPAGSLPDKK